MRTAKGKTVIGDSPVEITFDLTNGRIYGNDGCNVINGTAFFENENGLRFESLISTMKACRPEVTDRTVLNALNETRSYKRADTKELSIKFCDENGKSQLSTEKKSPKKIRLWLSISQRQNYLDLQAVTVCSEGFL